MALVVFLKGINVGGHRRVRPVELAHRLADLDVTSIGAAGTFVIRQPISRPQLRAEIARHLAFEADAAICDGREIVRLIARNPFARHPARPDVVRFVSLLARRPQVLPPVPMHLPARRAWLLKVLAVDNRFVLGVYRRHMKVIGYLAALDRHFGVPVTTRNWSTVTAIGKVLHDRPGA